MLTEHSSNLSKEFAQLNNTYLAVWPDLAKFRHFGNILKVFGPFFEWPIQYLANFCTNLGIFMLLGKSSLL